MVRRDIECSGELSRVRSEEESSQVKLLVKPLVWKKHVR